MQQQQQQQQQKPLPGGNKVPTSLPKQSANPFLASKAQRPLPKVVTAPPKQPITQPKAFQQPKQPAKSTGVRPPLSTPQVATGQADLGQTAQGVATLWQNNLTDSGAWLESAADVNKKRPWLVSITNAKANFLFMFQAMWQMKLTKHVKSLLSANKPSSYSLRSTALVLVHILQIKYQSSK